MRRESSWIDHTGKLVALGLLALGAAIVFLPIYWTIATSLKTGEAVFAQPIQWLPLPPQWHNYPDGFSQFTFPRYILNSFVVAIVVTASNALFCSLAGYSLTKYTFPGREFIFIALLSTLMLPIEVVLVPTFLVVKQFGWLNSYQGLIAPFVIDAFGIFLMRQFILQLPTDLIEAARVDGSSEFGIYWRIVLPNVTPALAALAIFIFRDSWDQYIWPLVLVTQNDLKTLPLGIAQFENDFASAYNQQMAIAMIGMIPMALLFFFMQRAFVQGITFTGLKE